MVSRPFKASGSIVASAVIVLLAVGVTAGVLLTHPQVPRELSHANKLTLVPVTARSYDDARAVTVAVSAAEARKLTSPRAGRVSSTSCTPGSKLNSGESTIALNGAGLLSLSTAVPLWRDLDVGATGTDAAALNTELTRLGYPAPSTNKIGVGTVEAYQSAAQNAGALSIQDSVIPVDGILWLIAAQVTVAACPVKLGDIIGAGDPIIVLASTPTAKLAVVPADPVLGDRILTVNTVHIPVAVDGNITDPTGLSALLATENYLNATPDSTGVRQLSAVWKLAQPANVYVVPPSAIVGSTTDSMCLVTADQVKFLINVVGSQLGQTFIKAADGTPPSEVLAAPDPSTSCK